LETFEKIIILDFGSQYTQLIARKVRECGVYCKIYPYTIDKNSLLATKMKGLILSGGPLSVYADTAPIPSIDIFNLDVPVLGICYGLQLLAFQNGGIVDKAARREYGRANLFVDNNEDLFKGVSESTVVWMSHGDALVKQPEGFEIIAHSANSPVCAVRSKDKRIFGVQFHPEVHHTAEGKAIINNFLREICRCKDTWNAQSFIEKQIRSIKNKVKDDEVILALSGGVDSTVAAVLLHKAIGEKLHCVHVDTGLMRKNESKMIINLFKESFNIPVDFIDAGGIFLEKLNGVSDPEKKRKIIGATFIDCFNDSAKHYDNIKWLAQGTLYPDVIESISVKGPSATIKSHHNVGGLPEKMKLQLIEPFRELFKDEVRAVGRELGVPEWFIGRHPFPGPGLAIRILGEVSAERIKILQEADEIYIEELKTQKLYDKIWQAFAVLLPVQSVGVMGDERTYENVCALRAVTSVDGMTADWYAFQPETLATISNRIINEIRGINRVVYDITSKPPGTIEWE